MNRPEYIDDDEELTSIEDIEILNKMKRAYKKVRRLEKRCVKKTMKLRELGLLPPLTKDGEAQ